MTFDEYVKATRQTWRDEDAERLQIAHAAMGLAGEWKEYSTANFADVRADELGDCWYYATRLYDICDTMIQPFSAIERRYRNNNYMNFLALGVIERAKKIAFQGAPLDILDGKLVYLIVTGLCHETDSIRGWTRGDLWGANIAKLTDRYPDGFETGGGVREEGGDE